MTPVAGKPAIFWTMQELLRIGVRRVCIVVRERGNDLENFVNLLYEKLASVEFVTPDRMAGVGYSVWFAAVASKLDRSPVLVVLGDTILNAADFPDTPGSWVALAEVEDQERWCMALCTEGRVGQMFDKPMSPVPARHACIGIYYFEQGLPLSEGHIATLISAKRKIEMVDLLQPLIEAGGLRGFETSNWLDVGNADHLQDAQKRLIQSRSFNSLRLDGLRGSITKKSTYTRKFFDEINYYKLLPDALKIYFPRVISSSSLPHAPDLTLEYYAYPTLSDLFLFEDCTPAFWRRIFKRLVEIQKDFGVYDYGTDAEAARDVYVGKNIARFEEFLRRAPEIARSFLDASAHYVNAERVVSPRQVIELSRKGLFELAEGAHWSPIHGDLCFSNILCEPSTCLIKLIDPRGSFGRQGILGDRRYDLAKLNHSVFGHYDFIINDLFAVHMDSPGSIRIEMPYRTDLEEIAREFTAIVLDGANRRHIDMITAWLFLSMLPLHADKPARQMAMLGIGLKLLTPLL